jgi:23S rRNA (uracil1939-C5)-methyltransferase
MKKHSPARSAPDNASDADGGANLVTAVIESIGALGHGAGSAGDITLFVPFTLPGERVRFRQCGSKNYLLGIENPSADRVSPICPHFGTCGGCTLQHWREGRYLAWKADLVSQALSRAGIEADKVPVRSYPTQSRRRAAFAAIKRGGGVELGFREERSHEIAGIEECPILLPAISNALPALRAALAEAMPAATEAVVHVQAAANGLDCVIEAPIRFEASRARSLQRLSGLGFIRVHWNSELVLMAAAPFVRCGDATVALPANGFMQAVEACEADMARFVCDVLGERRPGGLPVCDLFAGFGALSFPTARHFLVTAFESNQGAIEALAKAAKQTPGIKAVAAKRRDLYRNPLGPLELNSFSGALLNPPRAGAEAQCRQLARSKLQNAVMLSCNPVSFARDAAILFQSGFELRRIAAFDQFRFSPHVEIAAFFQRSNNKRGRPSPASRKSETSSL